MENCPHCDAPLKPAATYCLACDRPVAAPTSRLSVADAVPVRARPPVVLAAVAIGLVVLGGLIWGYVAYLHHGSAREAAQARANVRRGTTLLVDAESGKAGACQRSTKVLAGPATTVLTQCQGLVGHDPGARVASISVDGLDLRGSTGSIHLKASIADRTGTHNVDRVVDLVRSGRLWRMKWDGRPEI